MADQHLSTAEKKSTKKGGANLLSWDLIKRPKSTNAAGSVSSASAVHDPVPGNDAGTAEPTAAREFVGSISKLLIMTQPLGGNAASHQGMYTLLS